jgi:nucleoid-associated protein YgaU
MATHRTKSTHPIRNLTAAASTGTLAVLGITGTAAAAGNDWSGVAQCESSGDWSINTGNGFYGGLQFTQSTWDAYKPAGAPARADLASREQQEQAAEATLAAQGVGAWPHCGQYLEEGTTVAVSAPQPAQQTSQCDWLPPVDAVLTQGFHGGHNGIDLGADYGTPIYATASGTIVLAGPFDPGGYGNYIEQITDSGYTVQYGHISEWYVGSGDYVEAGSLIGAVGNAGSSTGPHLHLRVTDGSGNAVDPETLFYCVPDVPAPKPPLAPEVEENWSTESTEPEPSTPIFDELYTIVTGDTLSDIAARVDLTWQTLADMNPYITNPDLIYPGDQLVLDLEVNP